MASAEEAAAPETAAGVEEAANKENKSKVAKSIEEKGEHSYYFAHARPKEDLSQAQQIILDDRLTAKLDGMVKLAEAAEAVIVERKVKWREDYAWGDERGKVKIYLDFPEGSLGHRDVKVETKFEEFSFEVIVRSAGGSDEPVGITNGEHRLSGPIDPEKCSWRINSTKSRLTVTLVKADPEDGGWATLKKHVISKATGWN